MVNVSRSNMYIVKRRGSLCAESEREGTAKKEHSLEKCGRSVAESVAATKSVAHNCGSPQKWVEPAMACSASGAMLLTSPIWDQVCTAGEGLFSAAIFAVLAVCCAALAVSDPLSDS